MLFGYIGLPDGACLQSYPPARPEVRKNSAVVMENQENRMCCCWWFAQRSSADGDFSLSAALCTSLFFGAQIIKKLEWVQESSRNI